MKVQHIESIPAGNPFQHDLYHMGTRLGTNCMVMYGKHDNKEQPYIIIVNTKTGERVQINLNEQAEEATNVGKLANQALLQDHISQLENANVILTQRLCSLAAQFGTSLRGSRS